MWFESERETAQRFVERTVRRVVGRRRLVLAIGILLLGGMIAVATPHIIDALSWFHSIWNFRLDRASAYVHKVGTAKVFSHRTASDPLIPNKVQHQIVTLDQSAVFNSSECVLEITEARQA